MSAQPDNALTALERARQAQERFERRIDVQLRLPMRDQAEAEAELARITDALNAGGVVTLAGSTQVEPGHFVYAQIEEP